LKGSFPKFEPATNLTADTLVGTKMTWSRSAVRNAFLCLLAIRDPVHLINNSRLDLVNGGISDFTSPEKHHIFPQAFLSEHGTGEAELHALPNFCFLPAELNKRILDDRPSVYFPEFRQENDQFEDAIGTHLIPAGKDSGIETDDYLQFLKARSELIMEEIERLTGLSTAPPQDRRHKTIERLELRLRDLIHNALNEGHGSDYWKQTIPQDVRDEVEKRIAMTLRKQAKSLPADFNNPRAKLDFCTLSEYAKIVHVKNNWPLFQPVFRRESELSRHIESLSEFRNALVHSRSLTEVSRRAGELAVVWFETVLAEDRPGELDAEESAD
jgi:hypothetical protein